MVLSYEAKLRRDLHAWQQGGLISPEQRRRIEQERFRQRSLAGLQSVLILCVVILLVAATSALVAANWAGLSAGSRIAILLLGNAAAVALTFALARRNASASQPGGSLAVDATAALSLATAVLSIALVAQTFHVPSDPQGFARTVAALGLVTTLVAGSRISALVGALALAAAAVQIPWFVPSSLKPDNGPVFWTIAAAYFATAMIGWLPARVATLLVLLGAVTIRLGDNVRSGELFLYRAELVFSVALAALAMGQALACLPARGWIGSLREGGAALVRAASGLCLLAILAASVRTFGWGWRSPSFLTWPSLLAAAAATASMIVPWRIGQRRVTPLLPDVIVLGAAVVSLLLLLVGSYAGVPARGGSPFWTVWTGVVPTLALIVAGHHGDRRNLYGCSLAAVVGLVIALLVVSGDLIGFSANLLASAVLVAATGAICRWADGRAARSPA